LLGYGLTREEETATKGVREPGVEIHRGETDQGEKRGGANGSKSKSGGKDASNQGPGGRRQKVGRGCIGSKKDLGGVNREKRARGEFILSWATKAGLGDFRQKNGGIGGPNTKKGRDQN